MAGQDNVFRDDQGVTVDDLREYIGNPALSDHYLQTLISDSEANAKGAIDDSVPIETYRKYPDFNQAVRILADFENWARGQHTTLSIAYPRSYLYRINSVKYKILGSKGDAENGAE